MGLSLEYTPVQTKVNALTKRQMKLGIVNQIFYLIFLDEESVIVVLPEREQELPEKAWAGEGCRVRRRSSCRTKLCRCHGE
jgi:hypothetical protein